MRFVTAKVIYDPSRLLGGREWIVEDKSIETELIDHLTARAFGCILCEAAASVTIENDIMNIKFPEALLLEDQETTLHPQLIDLSPLEFYVIKPNKSLNQVDKCTYVQTIFLEQYIDKDSYTLQFKVLETKTGKEVIPYCHKWLTSHRRVFENSQNIVRTGYLK